MFTGKEPHEIDAATARTYIRSWRERAAPGHTRGGFFGREVLVKMLAQPACAGLRIYHARHEKGHDTFVVVAADADGRDLWQGTVAENMLTCPPYCPADE
jgi:hypothetical protein